MREHHVQTVRSARFYTLGEMDDRVTDVWLVCHGYGQLAGEFMRSFERITDPLRLIVAPAGAEAEGSRSSANHSCALLARSGEPTPRSSPASRPLRQPWPQS